MVSWLQWGFQDAISPIMEEFLYFHDIALMLLTFIITLVFYMIVMSNLNSFVSMSLLEGQLIEAVWTAVPANILVLLAGPSLTLLYLLDDSSMSQVSVKVIAHQWYWTYEYQDLWNETPSLTFDSYMLNQNQTFRLLDVDNRASLPFNTRVRVLISSADVLHSWTVPSLGVKADASPGRINQLSIFSARPGVYFGQCSEICGANHSFMPICVEFISPIDFFWWTFK